MEDESELLAAMELVAIDRDGSERSFVVGVGRPHRRPTGEWACLTLSPDLSEPRPIYGEDSLQALCLGLSFIRRSLEHLLEGDRRLLWAETRDEISRDDLGAWFSGVGDAGPG